MKPPRSEANRVRLTCAGLEAFVTGLLLSPFAYILIGALGGFAPAFSYLALPLLLAGECYLLYRYFSKPGRSVSGILSISAEIISWILIATFLVIISNFTLLTTFERIGLFSVLLFVTTLFSLPMALTRQTALRARLQQLPESLRLPLLLAIASTVVVVAGLYLFRTPEFPL